MQKRTKSSQKKRFQFLLMKAVDNVMTPCELGEFKRFLNISDDCRRRWQEFRKLKKVTQEIKPAPPSSQVWSTYWSNVYRQLKNGAA